MPDVIQKVPSGLLNYFRLQNGGVAPQTLTPFLQASMDLTDLYFNDDEEFYADGVVKALGGALGDFDFGGATNFPGVVPLNQFWYVREYQVQISVPAATAFLQANCTMQVNRKGQGGVGGRGVVAVGYSETKTGSALACQMRLRNSAPFWMPPDSILGLTQTSLDPLAAAATAFHSVKLIRFTR